MDQVKEKPKKHNHFYASIMAIDPEGKVLLGKRRKDGLWTPPAGSSHSGETPMETAIRETFEETGLVVKPYELQPLPTIDTNDRRVCHVFLWMCPPGMDMHTPKSNLDPDHEVEEWQWFDQREVPQDIHKDENRATSVNNAYMKFYGIRKGGPGSGVQGHTTMHPTEDKVINLTNKLTGENPFKSHLDKLKNGAVLEGVTLRSGKPVYLNLEQATAHGYTPNDYKEAANIHYDKAQAIATNIEKIKELKKPVLPEMEGILKFHKQQFKSNMGAAEKLGSRMSRTQSVIDKLQKPYKDTHDVRGNVKEVKKSDEQAEAQAQRRLQQLTQRRPELAEKHPEWAGGAQPVEKKAPSGVNPDKYERCVHHIKDQGKGYNPWAVCTSSMKKTEECDCKDCIEVRKSVVMMGHNDGAEVDTAKFATEYSAAFSTDWAERFYIAMEGYKYGDSPRIIVLDKGILNLVKVDDGIYTGSFIREESDDDGMLQDTAKVRIERMSIPSLIQFCIAKEWINPYLRQATQALEQALAAPIAPVAPVQQSPTIFDKIRVLELIDKLVE